MTENPEMPSRFMLLAAADFHPCVAFLPLPASCRKTAIGALSEGNQ